MDTETMILLLWRQSRRRFLRTHGNVRIGWEKFGNRWGQSRFMYTPESLFCVCRPECLPQRSTGMQGLIAFEWNDLRIWTRRMFGFAIRLTSSQPGQTRERRAKIPVFLPAVLPELPVQPMIIRSCLPATAISSRD